MQKGNNMKKVLSLILAIVMIAMLVPAAVVTAETIDDTKEMTVPGSTAQTGAIATVTKKYFAVSFTMKAAKNAGVLLDNGCCGIYFGDNDDNCMFIPYEENHTATQRGIGIWGGAKVVFGKWWGIPDFGAAANAPIDEYVDKYVTILALGTMNDNGTATISAYVNGKKVHVWGNQDEATGKFNGKLNWAVKLTGVTADIKFMQSDSPMLVIAPETASIGCTDNKVTVTANVVNNPGVNILPIYPSADDFDFMGPEYKYDEEEEEDVLDSKVFNDATVGVGGVVYDAGSKDTKKTGKLSSFTFKAKKSITTDFKVDLTILEAQQPVNLEPGENVPTFTVPAYVAVAHGEGKEIVDDSALVSGATCTSKAVYNKTCDCGLVLADTFEAGELAPHTWAEKADDEFLKDAATCTKKAVYYKSCSVCGAKSEDTFEYGEPTGDHNFTGDWKHDETDHWQNCGCGAEGPKTSHDYDNDCDADCNTCGATRTVNHNWAEKVADEYLKDAATCTKKAVYYKSCSVCGAKGEETFEAGETTDHAFGDWKHDNDKHWKECAGCGAKDAEAAHAYGEGVVTKEPTTTKEGEKTFTCECGATKTEKIDKLPVEDAPKTGSTTALIAAVALLSVTAGAAVVITRKKREI